MTTAGSQWQPLWPSWQPHALRWGWTQMPRLRMWCSDPCNLIRREGRGHNSIHSSFNLPRTSMLISFRSHSPSSHSIFHSFFYSSYARVRRRVLVNCEPRMICATCHWRVEKQLTSALIAMEEASLLASVQSRMTSDGAATAVMVSVPLAASATAASDSIALMPPASLPPPPLALPPSIVGSV